MDSDFVKGMTFLCFLLYYQKKNAENPEIQTIYIR